MMQLLACAANAAFLPPALAASQCMPLDGFPHQEQVVDALLAGRLFVGTLVPAGEVVVSAGLTGRVESIAVGAGHRVAQGAPLLRVAPPNLLHEIRLLQARSDEAQAAVDKSIAIAQSAKERLARRRSHPALFPAEEVAGAEYAVEEAEAEIRRARHAFEQIRLDLAKRQSDLANAEVHAPSTGVVTRIDVRAGEEVEVNSPLLVIESETGSLVRFLVPESAELPEEGEMMCVYASEGADTWIASLMAVSPTTDARARARIGEARFLPPGGESKELPRPGASLLLGRLANPL